MSDGRLWFNTKIDNTGIDKDLRDLEQKIKKSQDTIAKAENAKLPLVKQLEEAKAKLEQARTALASYKADLADTQKASKSTNQVEAVAASAALPEARAMVAAQEKEVAKLQKIWDGATNKVADYDRKIQQANADIERSKAKAAGLTAQLNSGGAKMRAAFDKARNSANRFGKRLLEIAKSALIFNLISSALRSVTNYMGKVLKTNSEYTAQLAKLKGALLTAFQPIYEFVLPGLLAVMRVLTAIVQVAANVLSALFGKSAADSAKNAKALNDEAKAIDAVGGAAKNAQKSLAGFDEINTVGKPETNGSGSGKDSGAVIAPDFEPIEITDDLERILVLVGAIGAALLTWTIASSFTSSLSLAAGLAIAVGGALLYAYNWADAFSNGISWENLAGVLAGMVLIAGGLGLAFGTTAAAISLLVTGIATVVLALYEWITMGQLSTEACATLAAGITAIGVAISLLTGSWIPAVIAAVVALIALVIKNWDVIKQTATKVWDKIKTIWASVSSWFNEKVIQPISKFFSNLWTSISTWAANAWNKAKIVWAVVSSWFNVTVIQPVTKFFSNLWNGIKTTATNAWNGIKTAAAVGWNGIKAVWGVVATWFKTTITQPVANFFSNMWNGLKEKAVGAWNGIKSVFGTVGTFFKNTFTKAWQGVINVFSTAGNIFKDIKDAIITAFKSIVNKIIKGLNTVIAIPFNGINAALNRIKNIKILGLTPFSGIRTISVPSIPYLAQGAVLPANKPFLAMVGDQKHGTNVEAPLSTIQEAVAAVMADFQASNLAGHEATVAVLRDILEAVLGIHIGDDVISAAVDRYNRKMAVAKGG